MLDSGGKLSSWKQVEIPAGSVSSFPWGSVRQLSGGGDAEVAPVFGRSPSTL